MNRSNVISSADQCWWGPEKSELYYKNSDPWEHEITRFQAFSQDIAMVRCLCSWRPRGLLGTSPWARWVHGIFPVLLSREFFLPDREKWDNSAVTLIVQHVKHPGSRLLALAPEFKLILRKWILKTWFISTTGQNLMMRQIIIAVEIFSAGCYYRLSGYLRSIVCPCLLPWRCTENAFMTGVLSSKTE